MSKLRKPVMLNETGQQIAEALHRQNLLLNIIADSAIEGATSFSEIQRVVKSGNAAKVFNIGDQIIVPWTDKATGTTYQVPHDIVHFGNVELLDGETVPAMFLQWHYCTPFGVQFDAREAMYAVPAEGLAVGTYHFNVASAWNKILVGNYQFTTTQTHTEGQQFVLREAYADYGDGLTNAYIDVYANGSSTEVITSYKITPGSSGTDLGEFKSAGDTNLWSYHAACYGYSRWSKSGIRQWLNSSAAPGNWWTQQSVYDRKPKELSSKHGFMSGYESDFLSILNPIKITTALNTVTDDNIEDDDLEDTFDTFFLPSLSNIHANPQLAGEGDIFEYWKRVSQSSTPLAQYGTYPQMRTYGVDNHNSAQAVRIRSATRGRVYGTWYVNTAGAVSDSTTTFSAMCSPVCAIC